MSPLYLEISLAILIGAITIDFIFGEPRKYVHPVTVVRRVSLFFDPYIRMIKDKQLAGFVFTLFVSFIFGILIYVVLSFTKEFVIAYVIIAVILLKGTFSLTAIGQDINPVVRALEEGRIEEARTFASRIIKRDTTGMDE